ncbi:MAG: hypothetical protein AB1592_18005 [Pseudomonadota bacterium]
MGLPSTASSLCRVLAPAALALMLAGCGGNSQGLFGAPGTTVDPSSGAQRISDQAVAGVGGPVTGVPQPLALGSGPDAIEYSCPMVDVRSGASAWQVPAPGGGLRYQGSISNLARECAIIEGTRTMTMKVGIEGRVLLGDKGTPGAVNVPIRIAVVQEGPTPKTIQTKFFNVPVNVPAAEGQVTFSVVEDTISFPLASPGEIERYVVYAGFDPKGTPAQPARPSRPRPAAPTASAAPAATPAPAATTAPAATPAPAAAPAAAAPAASSSSSSGSSSSGTFGPPPSAGTFGPPPTTFGPPPAQ